MQQKELALRFPDFQAVADFTVAVHNEVGQRNRVKKVEVATLEGNKLCVENSSLATELTLSPLSIQPSIRYYNTKISLWINFAAKTAVILIFDDGVLEELMPLVKDFVVGSNF